MINYHVTDYSCIKSIEKEGLLPKNGFRTQTVGDKRSAIFYSEGEAGAILMHFCIKGFYDYCKEGGLDYIIDKYNDYLKNKIKLNDEEAHLLKKRVIQMKKIKSSKSEREFVNSGIYLTLGNLDLIETKDESYSIDNRWIFHKISPDKINVAVLKNKNTSKYLVDNIDILNYFMYLIPYNKLILAKENMDERYLKYISDYYQENAHIIATLGNEYELNYIPLKQFTKKYKIN